MEQDMRHTGNYTVKGLCVDCAMRRHTFNEVTGRNRETGHLDYAHLSEALIDGRRHILLSRTWTHQEVCAECNQTRPILYVPMK